MADNSDATWKYFRYDPSMAAAVIFIVMFFSTTSLHLYQVIRTKTWYFVPLIVGGFFESIGYIGRALSSQQSPNWTLGPYIIQTLLTLLAPALFAASIYMELGRIILLVDGESHSLIKRYWLTKVFVAGDVLAFSIQSVGGAMMARRTLNALHTGEHIVVGGLLLQVLFFGFFMIIAVIFNVRIQKVPTARAASSDIPWRKHLYALYAASVLIMVRSIFRVVEYIQGNDGYLLRHEYYLYIFDAVLMLGIMMLFNVIHPSEVKALLQGGKVSRGGLKLYTLDGSDEYAGFRARRDEVVSS